MRRCLKMVIILVLFYMIGNLILCPLPTMEAVRRGMNLCIRVVIPSLFPFLVCSRLLIDLGMANFCSRMLSRWMRPLFGIPGSGALAVVLGILSGYPVGAATVVNLYEAGACTKSEGERMLAFCNNGGPLFILGSVGAGILGNREWGIMLYLVHLVSALLTGLLFRKSDQRTSDIPTLPPAAVPISNPATALMTAISDGVNTLLKICGFVVFFSVVSETLPWDVPLFHALLEITGGIQALADQSVNLGWLLPVISALLAFSGASILLQTSGIVLPSGLSMKFCILGKIVQAVLSFFLTFFLCSMIPIAETVFAGSTPVPALPTIGQLLTLTAVEFLVAVGTVFLFCTLALLAGRIQRKK